MYQAQTTPYGAVQVTTLGGSALPSAGELPAAQATTYTPGTYGGVTYTPGTAYTPGTTSAGTATAYTPPAYSSYSTPTIAGGAAYTSTSSPYGAYTGAYTPSTYASALPAYGNTYGGYYGSAPVTGSSYAAAPTTETTAATYGTPAMAAATAYGNGSFTAAPTLESLDRDRPEFELGTSGTGTQREYRDRLFFSAWCGPGLDEEWVEFRNCQHMEPRPAFRATLQPAPSMIVPPATMNPLQSAPSMIAYGGGGGFGLPPMSGYTSAMDGPFKFYATPPGKLPDTARGDPLKAEEGSQTG
ncbi:unnamed protein product, partial [Symbiodinium sp. CCMP2456]